MSSQRGNFDSTGKGSRDDRGGLCEESSDPHGGGIGGHDWLPVGRLVEDLPKEDIGIEGGGTINGDTHGGGEIGGNG